MSLPVARPTERLPRWLRIGLLLTPALAVVLVLFGGGLALTLAQSLGYRPGLPGAGFSVEAYRALVADPAVTAAIGITLRVAVTATALSAVLGVGVALLVRSLGRTRPMFAGLLQVTLPLPHIVAALAMILLLSPSGGVSRGAAALGLVDEPAGFPTVIADGFGWGIVVSYVWKETPFVAVLVLAALSGEVARREDAARVLGAGWWQRLRHVLVPALVPTVAAASVLVLAFTIGSYEVPYLLGRPYPTMLPVVAYERFRDPDLAARPLAMAVAVLIAVLAAACTVAYFALARRLRR